jgi:hypothetical protein
MSTSLSGINTVISSDQQTQKYQHPSNKSKTAPNMDESQKTTATPSLSGSSLHELEPENHNPALEKPQPDVEKATPNTAPSSMDWDGPDDLDNPLNWPAWKRHYHIVPPAAISFTT